MAGNYIKIDRKIMEWEWYKNKNTLCVFLHCLLKANWKDGKFEGLDVPRGSFVTSVSKLSHELNMSVKQVRTALEHLKTTNELAIKTTSKFSVVTVNNYDYYQDEGKQNGKQRANEGQTKGKQRASEGQTKGNNRRKKEGKKEKREEGKNISKEPYFPNDDKLNQAFEDYIDMRRQIKAPMTDRAITMAKNKLQKLAATPFGDMMDNDKAIEILNEATIHNWKGLYQLKDDTDKKSNLEEWRDA